MKAPAILLVLAAISAPAAVAQQPDPKIDVPPNSRVVLEAKGEGVQIYTCTRTPAGEISWGPSTPDAKLLDAKGTVIGSHFAGPTWKLTRGGEVQGENPSRWQKDEHSIPWLRLDAKPGTGKGKLAAVTYIRRTDTTGGLPDKSQCQSEQDLTKKVRIDYTATYTFYAKKRHSAPAHP